MVLELHKTPKRRKATITIALASYAIRFINIAENFVLIPLYLKYIGAELYGYWLASGGILAWLGLFDFGVAGLISQRCAQYYGANDFDKTCAYFSHGMIVYLLMSVIIIFVCFGLSFAVGPIFRIADANRAVIRYSFLLAGLGMVTSIMREVLVSFCQAVQRPALSMYTAVAAQVVHFGVCLWLILAGWGLYSIPVGLIVRNITGNSYIAIEAIGVFKLLGGKLKFNKAVAMDYLYVGPLMVMARLGSQAVLRIEPTLITLFLGPELATGYVITKKLGEIMEGFLHSIRGSILPGFAHLCGQNKLEKARSIYKTFMVLMFWGGIAMLVAYICINKSFLELWVGPGQFTGMKMTFLIALSILFSSLMGNTSEIYSATGAIGKGAAVIAIGNGIRIACMAGFLPLMGVIGLPLATIFSAAFPLVFFLNRIHNLLVIKEIESAVFFLGYIPGFLLLGIAGVIGGRLRMDSWLAIGVSACAAIIPCIIISAVMSKEIRTELIGAIVIIKKKIFYKKEKLVQ